MSMQERERGIEMSMSMMNNSPGVCCVLEVQYARHLALLYCQVFASRDSSSSGSTDESVVTRSSATMDNTRCIQQLSLITHESCDMTVRHR